MEAAKRYEHVRKAYRIIFSEPKVQVFVQQQVHDFIMLMQGSGMLYQPKDKLQSMIEGTAKGMTIIVIGAFAEAGLQPIDARILQPIAVQALEAGIEDIKRAVKAVKDAKEVPILQQTWETTLIVASNTISAAYISGKDPDSILFDTYEFAARMHGDSKKS